MRTESAVKIARENMSQPQNILRHTSFQCPVTSITMTSGIKSITAAITTPGRKIKENGQNPLLSPRHPIKVNLCRFFVLPEAPRTPHLVNTHFNNGESVCH